MFWLNISLALALLPLSSTATLPVQRAGSLRVRAVWLAAQDPYARVLPGEPLSSEPYGMAMRSDDVDLVRFVNARLDRIRSDGEWQRAYNRWLAADLGKATPPEAEYGR